MRPVLIKPGASAPIVFRPRQPDGTVPDLAGASCELRVAAEDLCLILRGVATADGFDVDPNALDLPEGVYRASLYFDWGQGWRYQGFLFLQVVGGC